MSFLKNLFHKPPAVEKTEITKRFDLIGRVGQGSMSKVWRARDTFTGNEVAVKVLDKVKMLRFESRFPPELKKPSEGEVAVTFKHPGLVHTLEYGTTTEDEQFLVMEFVEGLGLSYLVDTQNEMMQSGRLRFIVQLAEAIDYFHKEGWIHRDICPRNVLVDPDGVVKLIDFGLVVPNTRPFQAPGNRTGSANYMAPELIKRQRTDQRIDIFSFAVTAFEMFTRELPWDTAETLDAVLQHINQPPKLITEFVPGIDPELGDVLMKGLERDPRDRWQSMSEMVEALRDVRKRLHQQAKARQRKVAKPRPVAPANDEAPRADAQGPAGGPGQGPSGRPGQGPSGGPRKKPSKKPSSGPEGPPKSR
jgi:serine/threonine protein kinase